MECKLCKLEQEVEWKFCPICGTDNQPLPKREKPDYKLFHWHKDMCRASGTVLSATICRYIEEETGLPHILDLWNRQKARALDKWRFQGKDQLLELTLLDIADWEREGPRDNPSIIGFTIAIKDNLLGIAMCSELDDFSRTRGRDIAVGRMRKRPFRYDSDDEIWIVPDYRIPRRKLGLEE